jgi:hypothetical protein
MITREEHLKCAKKRALEYVEMGDLLQALTSIGSDLTKHPETQNHPGYDIGMGLYMVGSLRTPHEMRHFIEGFR